MISASTILGAAFPDATELDVIDRTGGGDHFQVVVTSPSLAGLSLVEQHRLVYEALAANRELVFANAALAGRIAVAAETLAGA